MLTRPQAFELIQQKCDFALQRHLVHVATAMEALHQHLQASEPKEAWFLVGLLHDIDWNETIQKPEEHCGEKTKQFLLEKGLPLDLVLAIQSHYDLLQIPRDNPIRQALFALDEISGFTVAAALVRPTKMQGMNAASVLKKMKDKAFAKAVNRDDMRACELYFKIPQATLLDSILLPAFLKIEQPWGWAETA